MYISLEHNFSILLSCFNSVNLQSYIGVCLYVCVCVWACMCVCGYICVSTCVHMYMYLCTFVLSTLLPSLYAGVQSWKTPLLAEYSVTL